MRKLLASICTIVLLVPNVSRAVIFYDSGDPTYHASAPAAPALAALWNSQGAWGDFIGTPISSNMFITAKHVGLGVNNQIVFGAGTPNAGTYTATAVYDSPLSDLRIVQISGNFNSWVPLMTEPPLMGDNYIVFGRGTQRGAAYVNTVQRGWQWGTEDHQMRWGTGELGGTTSSGGKQYLYDQFTGAGTVQLSVGDSAGAMFVNDDGVWKLAGINYAVTGPYSATNPGTVFNAALYNSLGMFEVNTDTDPDTYSAASPNGAFFSSSVAAEAAWIASVIPEPSTYALAIGSLLVVSFFRFRRRASQ